MVNPVSDFLHAKALKAHALILAEWIERERFTGDAKVLHAHHIHSLLRGLVDYIEEEQTDGS